MAEKPKKAKKVNWKKIQTEYITQNISQRKLAAKYKVSYDTLKRKCAEEGWVELKKEHKRNVTAKAMDAIAGAQARDLAKVISIADQAVETLAKVYEDPNQFYRHLVEIETATGKTVEEREYQKADTKAMRDCVMQLKELTAICRDLYELPAKKADENENKGIEIVLKAGPEEWNE